MHIKNSSKKVSCAKNFHIDTTYKVTYPDYPLLVFGCSDPNNKFNPLFFALTIEETTEMLANMFEIFLNFCTKENVVFSMDTLTADMAPQFNSLVQNFFKRSTILHCSFHVKNAVENDLSKFENYKEGLLNEFVLLQCIPIKEIFEIGYALWIKKYRKVKQTSRFFDEFDKKE